MATTLVVNPGSSSKKYALYDGGALALEWRFETTDAGFVVCTQSPQASQTCAPVTREQFREAFSQVATEVTEYLTRKQAGTTLDGVVVRVVAPGTALQTHQVIDDAYIKILKQAADAAPLHVPHIVHEWQNSQQLFPKVPVVAASDSAFHATMPAVAREYSLAATDRTEGDIYRFGYHGLSVSSVLRRVPTVIGSEAERVVVCHVGNGVSVTAVQDGKSVDTTMGYSPVSGVVMGSRAGDVDAGALLALMRKKHLKVTEAEVYLNSLGGLQGLAEQSDIRQLLERRSQHDATAAAALDTFAYHIQKAIAGATVALGGLDVLVFTATAAVRSCELRALICARLMHFGIELDTERNRAPNSCDGVVSTDSSAVQVAVVRTDEMGEMACVAAELLAADR